MRVGVRRVSFLCGVIAVPNNQLLTPCAKDPLSGNHATQIRYIRLVRVGFSLLLEGQYGCIELLMAHFTDLKVD